MNCVRRSFAVLTLTLMISQSGCSPTAGVNWGTASNFVSHRDDTGEYSYGAEYFTRNGRGYLLFVAALSTGGRSKGGQGIFEGVFHFKDEIGGPWSCTSQDGQNGKIIIDGKEFDLTAGALFLISAKDKAVHVQQLVISAEQLQTCSDAKRVITVLKGNPEAEAFLQSCRPNH